MTKNTTEALALDSDTDLQATQIKAGRPKNLKKRQQILSAASELFLQKGFSASSMDNVAQGAGVSKQTVYSHFANKEALFTAVIQHKVDQYQLDGETAACQHLSLEDRLNNVAQRFVRLLLDPEAIAMYRIVIGEFKTAPQAAELFYQAGPQHGINMLSEILQQSGLNAHSQQGINQLAAEFFNLLKGEYHMKSLLGFVIDLSSDQEKELINNAIQHVVSRVEQLKKS